MITIEKSIERQETFIERHPGYSYSDLIPAMQLGIEALKFKKALADSPYGPRYALLPGETKDNGGH